MPGNTIRINDYAEWYVGDSRMAEFEAVLQRIAYPNDEGAAKRAGEIEREQHIPAHPRLP